MGELKILFTSRTTGKKNRTIAFYHRCVRDFNSPDSWFDSRSSPRNHSILSIFALITPFKSVILIVCQQRWNIINTTVAIKFWRFEIKEFSNLSADLLIFNNLINENKFPGNWIIEFEPSSYMIMKKRLISTFQF